MDQGFRRGFTTAEKTELWIDGSAGVARRSVGRLVNRHRRFISRCHRTVGFVQLPGAARGWR